MVTEYVFRVSFDFMVLFSNMFSRPDKQVIRLSYRGAGFTGACT